MDRTGWNRDGALALWLTAAVCLLAVGSAAAGPLDEPGKCKGTKIWHEGKCVYPDAAKADSKKKKKKKVEPVKMACNADGALRSTVVARVNGSTVDAADYVRRLEGLTSGKVTCQMLKKTVIDRLINDELLHQEIENLGITVSDEEVAQAMNMDMERFRKQMGSMSARVDAFRERVGTRKLLQARGLLQEPTDAELEVEYQRRFGLKLDVATVAVSAKASSAESLQARKKAEAILAAVKAGQTLQDAVQNRKNADGRRIVVKPMFIKQGDDRHEALWKAANPLSEKDYGGPVETGHGWVVFQLGKRIAPRRPFAEMKDKLRKSALNMKVAQSKHIHLEKLRSDANIEYLLKFDK